MPEQQEASVMKVADLKPTTKQASLVAKVVNIGERRTIDSKFGEARQLAEAVIGDDTGTGVLSLWGAQIDQGRRGGTLPGANGGRAGAPGAGFRGGEQRVRRLRRRRQQRAEQRVQRLARRERREPLRRRAT